MRGQRHAPAALYPGKDPVPIVQEAGWAPGPVWTGAENLATAGIRYRGPFSPNLCYFNSPQKRLLKTFSFESRQPFDDIFLFSIQDDFLNGRIILK